MPGATAGHARKTVGGASCLLDAQGTVRCDFGPRDPLERERTQNPGAGCYVNTGTGKWECAHLPGLHGQAAQIQSVHVDPSTGQTWANVGARRIPVPAFPVSVGRRRRTSSTALRKSKCKSDETAVYDINGKFLRCEKRKIQLPDTGGHPIGNPMTVSRGEIMFSPPATSRLFARVSNADRRRMSRISRSATRDKQDCAAMCAAQYGKNTPAYFQCVQRKCGSIGVPSKPGAGRTAMRARNAAMAARAITGTITAAPSGPGKWTGRDAQAAGCCVFLDGQGGYLTCDQKDSPLHGLEVQVQAVHQNEGLATVCHPTFTEGCWRLPLCPEAKKPSTCCVEMGQFEHNGITFTGRIKCSDPSDSLNGMPVMAGQPYQKGNEIYVSFDLGGDTSAELPVCVVQATPRPHEEPVGPQCCVVENPDGTVTLLCDPDPYGWNGMNITGANCMDTQSGRMCAFEFTDAQGNQVQYEAPVCPKIPPTFIPPQCCVDATTQPQPTLQNCSDPSYNGTPVDILDVDEASGTVMVAVPWSSTPVQMPLCKEPPGRCPPCPECPPPRACPPPRECPPPGECPTCPPGHWMAPDGRCVQCPPGYLLNPATGECVPPGECPTCPPGTYLDTNTMQCVTCPECPEYPPTRIPPPWPCCPDDENCDLSPAPRLPHFPDPGAVPCNGGDCQMSPTPRLPHFPDPGSVPGCDEPCCYECSMTGAGTVSNPCNPCRAGRR